MYFIHSLFHGAIIWVLYLGMFAAFLLAVFWRPIVGLLYAVPMLPLSTLRYRLHGLPLADQFTDFLLLGVILGLLLKREEISIRNRFTPILVTLAIYTYLSLWMPVLLGRFSPPWWFSDPRLSDWKNIMIVPMIVFVCVLAVARTTREMKILLLAMCLSMTLLNRNLYHNSQGHLSTYRDDARAGSVTLGSNETGALEAQFCMFLFALRTGEKNRLARMGYLALALLSGYCVMVSFSRGAYAALLAGWLVYGLFKERKLFLLLIVFLATWESVVPNAVRERVLMTYSADTGLDGSALERISLWDDALEAFSENPVLGRGYNTYKHLARLGFRDTHNYYIKVIFETGIVGLILFLLLLRKLFSSGYQLFRRANDPFLSSLGLGLFLWMVCSAVGNMFGDRWSYIQISGYLWAIAAMVVRGLMITEDTSGSGEAAETAELVGA